MVAPTLAEAVGLTTPGVAERLTLKFLLALVGFPEDTEDADSSILTVFWDEETLLVD